MTEKEYKEQYVMGAVESLITVIGKYVATAGDDKRDILLLEKYARAKKLKLEKGAKK